MRRFGDQTMIRVSPLPYPWEQAYQQLKQHAEAHRLAPPLRPLVLSSWNCSDDIQKKERWEYHVQWANDNNCTEVLGNIPDSDFYFVAQLYVDQPYIDQPFIGLHFPRLFPVDDYKPKQRPSDERLAHYLQILTERWEEIVGEEIARIVLNPICFSGKKRRSLLLRVNRSKMTDLPWYGSHEGYTYDRGKRYSFTKFRASICKVIAPHAVDHISFSYEVNI